MIRTIALAAALLSGCSGGTGLPPGPDGGTCERTCAVTGPTCGVYQNACGDVVDCGACTFSTDTHPLAAGTRVSWMDAVLAPDGALEVMHADGSAGGIHVARRTGGTWTDDVAIAPTGTESIVPVDLAVAPDGTRWALYTRRDAGVVSLHAIHAAPGATWEDGGVVIEEDVPARLAVGADGAPRVLLVWEYDRAELATRAGTTWSSAEIPGVDPIRTFALAVAGESVLAAISTDDGVVLAELRSGAWSVETLFPGQTGWLDLAIAADGEPAVIAIEDDALVALERRDGSWRTTRTPDDLTPSFDAVGGAYAGDGTLWMALLGSRSILAHVTPVATPVQRLHRECHGPAALLADAEGPLVVDACDGAIDVHRPDGLRGETLTAACAAAQTALCDRICDGTCGPRCCWSYESDGSSGSSCQSEATCRFRMALRICGDLDPDPGLVASCTDAIPGATCDVESDLALPQPCADLY